MESIQTKEIEKKCGSIPTSMELDSDAFQIRVAAHHFAKEFWNEVIDVTEGDADALMGVYAALAVLIERERLYHLTFHFLYAFHLTSSKRSRRLRRTFCRYSSCSRRLFWKASPRTLWKMTISIFLIPLSANDSCRKRNPTATNPVFSAAQRPDTSEATRFNRGRIILRVPVSFALVAIMRPTRKNNRTPAALWRQYIALLRASFENSGKGYFHFLRKEETEWTNAR